MSSLVINFPDCATLGSHDEKGGTDQGDTITVFTEGCPTPAPSPPSPFGTGELIAVVGVSLALIIGVVVTRVVAHDNKPKLAEEARLAREAEINGQIEMAQARKVCPTCMDAYEPELKQ